MMSVAACVQGGTFLSHLLHKSHPMFYYFCQIKLSKPQEALMWEAFSHAILSCNNTSAAADPGALDMLSHWSHIACLTQQVVLAIDLSAKSQGKGIRVADLQPCLTS